MVNISKAYNWTLNVLSGLVGLVVLVVLIARFVMPTHQMIAAEEQLHVGKPFKLAATEWGQYQRTLVMGLQVGCQWCEASAPFYRELLRSNAGNAFHPIAVLPQPVSESKSFLHSLSIDVSDVRQVNLGDLGIGGTPTLVVVDAMGHVQSSWIGQLSRSLEDDVFQKLGIQRVLEDLQGSKAERNGIGLITGPEFIALRREHDPIPIVDINPRSEYHVLHISGALNIPADELEARAPHEIPPGSPVVVYCGYRPKCQVNSKSETLETFSFVGQPVKSYCAIGESGLQLLGFKRVLVLSDDLTRLETLGVRVDGARQQSKGS